MSGPGAYSAQCETLISQQMGGAPAMLVTSCSAALEIAAILLNLHAGDEVIMPSFTFTTTATSVVLRGATPVFVDVDGATFNIDPSAVERAIEV
jgi:dTDP-4-amino-4,6-dideoxygalactose transaminase